MAFFTVAVKAIYSNWYINSKTVTCSFNIYKISPLFNINIESDIKHFIVLFYP